MFERLVLFLLRGVAGVGGGDATRRDGQNLEELTLAAPSFFDQCGGHCRPIIERGVSLCNVYLYSHRLHRSLAAVAYACCMYIKLQQRVYHDTHVFFTSYASNRFMI